MTVKATIHYEYNGHPIEIKVGRQPAIWVSPAEAWQLTNQLHSAIMDMSPDYNRTPGNEHGQCSDSERDNQRGRSPILRLLRHVRIRR